METLNQHVIHSITIGECDVGSIPNQTQSECIPCDAGTFAPTQAQAADAAAGV
jgi:hypothetical protein